MKPNLSFPATFWSMVVSIIASGKVTRNLLQTRLWMRTTIILTLMAVARELNVYGIRDEADVHLAAGLPLTWISKQREDFRSYLLRNKEVNFRFNSKKYHIRFVGCSLFPQGYPAIVSRLGGFQRTIFWQTSEMAL